MKTYTLTEERLKVLWNEAHFGGDLEPYLATITPNPGTDKSLAGDIAEALGAHDIGAMISQEEAEDIAKFIAHRLASRFGDLPQIKALADIREIVGDPTGKLMQDELVEHVRKGLPRWIAVSERLPENETPVLAVHRGRVRILNRLTERPMPEDTFREFDYWDDVEDDGQDIPDKEVTHWQPLPPPPDVKP